MESRSIEERAGGNIFPIRYFLQRKPRRPTTKPLSSWEKPSREERVFYWMIGPTVPKKYVVRFSERSLIEEATRGEKDKSPK